MKIGLTYDLRQDYLDMGFSEEETAEFDKIDTIEGIENALKKLNFEVERIGHAKSLVSKLHEGKKWDLVFNIAEGLKGLGREAQVPAILDVYQIPYVFSDVLTLSLTLHKGMTKSVIRDNGIPTADFFVVNSASDIEKVKLPYPLFAKPVAEGTGKGINAMSKISNFEELKTSCETLLKQFNQPVLVETFLSGREFTVGIVGNGETAKVVGIMEIIFNKEAKMNAYSYDNKENYLEKVKYTKAEDELAEKCKIVALNSWRVLNCADGGRVDIRVDSKGIPNFIEVNPLAGLNPTHSDLPILCRMNNISYDKLIEMIMDASLKRHGITLKIITK